MQGLCLQAGPLALIELFKRQCGWLGSGHLDMPGLHSGEGQGPPSSVQQVVTDIYDRLI